MRPPPRRRRPSRAASKPRAGRRPLVLGLLATLPALIAAVWFTIGDAPPDDVAPRHPDGGSTERHRTDETTPTRDRRPIAGRVVDADGTSLPDVRVVLDRMPPGEPFAPPWAGPLDARSDDAGTFRFEIPADGELYRVEARAPGRTRGRTDDVAPGTTDVVLRLERAVAIRGVVVADGEGPLDGARVDGPGTDAFADRDGRFVLDGVAPGGGRTIVASASGFRSESVDVAVGDGPVELDRPIVLRRRAGVTGRVLSHDGTPLAGATVRLTSGFEISVFGITTDRGGRYWIDPSGEPGTRTLRIDHPTHETARVRDVPMRPGVVHVVPDVRLAEKRAIVGRVTGPDGRPVAGARFATHRASHRFEVTVTARWRPADAPPEPTSDADGRFRIDRDVEPGRFRLFVRAPGFPPWLSDELVVGESGATRVDVRLEAGRDVSGVAHDQDGRPVADARVELAKPPFGLGARAQALALVWDDLDPERFTTDEEGRFTARGLPRGGATLIASKDGYASRSVPVSGDAASIEIVLTATGSIRGVVVGAGGEPLSGGTVTLGSTNARRLFESRRDAPTADVAPNGTFALESVPAGTHTLTFDDPTGESPAVVVPDVVVEPGRPTEGVVIRVPAGATLRGVVVDPDDNPFPSARVRVVRGSNVRTAKAATDGTFEVGGLTEGRSLVLVDAPGHPLWRRDDVEIPARGDLRVELARGGSVAGVVRDDDGPVSGALISALELRNADVMRVGFPSRLSARTDDDGRFSITGVAPGTCVLMLSRLDDAMALPERRTAKVVAGETATVDFDLRTKREDGTFTLRARVLDRRGRPVGEGVIVVLAPEGAGRTLSSMDRVFTATTDAKGEVRIDGVPPGRYRAVRASETHVGGSVPIDLTRPPAGTVEIGMPAGALAGHVGRADGGAPIPGARVMLFDAAATSRGAFVACVADAKVDDRGEFVLEGVPPGRYVVLAAGHGVATATMRVTIPDGDAPRMRIGLAPGVELTIRLSSDGAAAVGADVALVDANGAWLPAADRFGARATMPLPGARTDERGAVRQRLAPGRYTIVAAKSGCATIQRSIEVGSTDETLELELDVGATVRLRVTSGGSPVEGARATVTTDAGTQLVFPPSLRALRSVSDADGTLVLEGLPDTDVDIAVSAPDGRTGHVALRARPGQVVEGTLELH